MPLLISFSSIQFLMMFRQFWAAGVASDRSVCIYLVASRCFRPNKKIFISNVQWNSGRSVGSRLINVLGILEFWRKHTWRKRNLERSTKWRQGRQQQLHKVPQQLSNSLLYDDKYFHFSWWSLTVVSDWLQGPYVYALYKDYGFSIAQIGQLFIAGFLSSALLGTVVSSLADK